MKRLLHLLLRVLFRFEGFGTCVLKTPGPVLLIPNHVSWFDWAMVGVLLEDDWKFVTSSTTAQASWLHRKVMTNSRCFPIDPASPYAVKRMAEYLQGGGRLVLFAEGRISLTGSLMKLFDGTGFLLHKTHAKVITCHLRNAFRLPWGRHPNRKQWFPKVTAHFSELLTPPSVDHGSTAHARHDLARWLRDQMIRQQFETEMSFGPDNLYKALFETAHQFPRTQALEDVTGQKLTLEQLHIGAYLMGRAARWNGGKGEHVGILLPNVNATPVMLTALWRLGKVPAILNYSSGISTMLGCSKLAGLKTIITSRTFIERSKLELAPLEAAGIQLIYLEDLRRTISLSDRIQALIRIKAAREGAELQMHRVGLDDSAVILFTSGSEGVPKGVVLSHRNLLANIRQMLAVTDMLDQDRLFNALPIFHSFGLTVGTLLPLVRGFGIFLYPSPLHYRVVPTAFYDKDCTVFLSTNTFLNGYSRKAHPLDFRSMRYLFAGAEKLQESTAQTWAQKFGVRVLEGYGATECGPGICVNTPLEPKHGSAGRFLPGLEYRLETVEGVETGGRLFVKGPNVMKGYLNEEPNAKFQALGGWYDTGDIVRVDEEGFVYIQGRLKRFAKISGEMVSLAAVEESLSGVFPQYGLRFAAAVVTRPDEEKGEALVVITNESKLTLDEVRQAVRAKGLPNLAIPKALIFLKEIPKLGSGKTDYRKLEQVLKDHAPVS